jgi:DNA-binding transcriptional regulator GbsR (MarR family)
VAVLKPRERLVYFRISEDEFHQFVSVCEKEGARSVSDLARSAVQRLIAEGDRDREHQSLAPKVETLEKLISELAAQLQFLSTLLQRQNGSLSGVTSKSAAAQSSPPSLAGSREHAEG